MTTFFILNSGTSTWYLDEQLHLGNHFGREKWNLVREKSRILCFLSFMEILKKIQHIYDLLLELMSYIQKLLVPEAVSFGESQM